MMYLLVLSLTGLLLIAGLSSANGFRSTAIGPLPRASYLSSIAASRARRNREQIAPSRDGNAFPLDATRRQLDESIVAIRGGASLGSKVISISDAEEFMDFIKKPENNKVVVDFSATWCGPCKMLAPLYEGWAVDPRFNGIKFVKVDPDETMGLVQSFQVRAFPTLLAIQGGQVVEQFVGANPPAIEQMLVRLRDR